MALKDNGCFQLQFFAQERTEPATPKKRSQLRAEGHVCRSRDLTAAAEILTGLACLAVLGASMFHSLVGYTRGVMGSLGDAALLSGGVGELASISLRRYFSAWLPLGVLVFAASTVVTLLQVGWKVSWLPLKFDMNRLAPASGLKKIISARTAVELIKGVLKAAVLVAIIFFALKNVLPAVSRMMFAEAALGISGMAAIVWRLSLALALALLAVAAADYLYQRWSFERAIMMSRQELRDEYRQLEGDPLLRSRMRKRQKALAKGRMMTSLLRSDVVLADGTNAAVAIFYDKDAMKAPQITAKGRGFVAARILALAEEHKLPVVYRGDLADDLCDEAEVGDEVPQTLYRRVAEVLANVYRMKKPH